GHSIFNRLEPSNSRGFTVSFIAPRKEMLKSSESFRSGMMFHLARNAGALMDDAEGPCSRGPTIVYPCDFMHSIQACSKRDCPLQGGGVRVTAPARAPATIASPMGLDMKVGPDTVAPALPATAMTPKPVAAPVVLQKKSRWNQLRSGESVGL